MNNRNIKFVFLLLLLLMFFVIFNSPISRNINNKYKFKEENIEDNNNNNNKNEDNKINDNENNNNNNIKKDNFIKKNFFGNNYIINKQGKKIKISDEKVLKEYPFPLIDLKTRYNTYFFEPMTSMYKKFPDVGKRVHYCKDLNNPNGDNVTVTFQSMYPSHEPTLQIYFNHYFDFPPEEIPSSPPSPTIPRVLHSLEPPYQRFCTIYEHCSNKFNWSISYERTADIRTGHCDDEEIFQILPWELDTFVMENKTKFAREFNNKFKNLEINNNNNSNNSSSNVQQHNDHHPLASWFCSKCNIHLISNRFEYVREMMKYINIDSYGSCLNNVKQTEKTGRFASDAMDVKQSLINNYKFYLAFESCNCLDYTTEKALHALKVGTVPVVMAHPQTLKYLPEGSFIYTGDFNSVRDLTNYLKYLDTNTEEYLKYFNWRFNQSIIEKWRTINDYPFRPNSRNWVCPLFHHYQNWKNGKIHSQTLHSTPYNDLCLPPNIIKI
ncbi:hypothetical protein ACTFIY_004816 [Dictyostelium cf. discoideum]